MDDELRDQIRRLAETARDVAASCRDDERPMSGEEWVLLDWMADELAAIDMRLSVEALRT